MNRDYKKLTQEIIDRQNPENIAISKALREELRSIEYSDVLLFIRTSMNEVDPDYTKKSKEAGKRVKDHLKDHLENVEYRYQGSVMTDTHIKGYSDIDLLTICKKFYSYDSNSVKKVLERKDIRSQLNENQQKKLKRERDVPSYKGNAIEDLRTLRLESESKLTQVYSKCDTTHPKAIKIENLDLHREVDIVTANWYDDIASILNDKGDFRGVQIYNKRKNKKGPVDFPFLTIERINTRSSETNGRLKKMIRFLKNVKVQSDVDIDLSSFDINAICYDLSTSRYNNASFQELVPILCDHLNSICTNSSHANNLKSVDGRETIFKDEPDKLRHLELLLNEVETINKDLQKVVQS